MRVRQVEVVTVVADEDSEEEDGVEEEEEDLALAAYRRAATAYSMMEPKISKYFHQAVSTCVVNDDLTDGEVLAHTVEGRYARLGMSACRALACVARVRVSVTCSLPVSGCKSRLLTPPPPPCSSSARWAVTWQAQGRDGTCTPSLLLQRLGLRQAHMIADSS